MIISRKKNKVEVYDKVSFYESPKEAKACIDWFKFFMNWCNKENLLSADGLELLGFVDQDFSLHSGMFNDLGNKFMKICYNKIIRNTNQAQLSLYLKFIKDPSLINLCKIYPKVKEALDVIEKFKKVGSIPIPDIFEHPHVLLPLRFVPSPSFMVDNVFYRYPEEEWNKKGLDNNSLHDWRNFYPIIEIEDDGEIVLYFNMCDNSWYFVDLDYSINEDRKEKFNSVRDFIAFFANLCYWETISDSKTELNDSSLAEIEGYYSKYCKALGLDWKKVKGNGKMKRQFLK